MAMVQVGRSIDSKLLARLAIGAVQGLFLLGLFRWQTAEHAREPWYFALCYGAALLPPPILVAWGAMRRRPLALWAALALAGLLGLGYFAAWRLGPASSDGMFGAQGFIFAALLMFISHHLVQVGVGARRWRGAYPEYFDLTWKHGVQLGLSGLFVGVFWLLLWLGGAMFAVISIDAVVEIITKDWFAIPITALAFAAAIHLTDGRASLVIGARTLALTLFSWLLPVMTAIAGAFLLALPIVGVAGLWETKFASALLMWAATALIFFINAAYQAGEKPGNPVIAWAVRLGAVLLVPLCGLAAYGLITRIGQYGLTPSRVIAGAGLIMLSGYALGYALAAASRGAWMAKLGAANVWCAVLSACMLLGMLTLPGDPSRLAVQSQLARLTRGSVTPEAFDYALLAGGGARWGEAALRKLSAASGDERAARIAALAKAQLERAPIDPETITLEARRAAAPDLTPSPAAPIPDGAYLELQDDQSGPSDCIRNTQACSMRQIDLDGDQRPEILFFNGGSVMVLEPGTKPDAPWRAAANACCLPTEAWAKGDFSLVRQRFAGLKAGDTELIFTPTPPR